MNNSFQYPTKGKIFKFLFYPTFLISVAMPHSFQVITAALIVLTALVSLISTNNDRIYKFNYIDMWFIISLFVNMLYIYIGTLNNSDPESIWQNVIVYTISPLLWIFIFKGVSKYIILNKFETIMSYYTVISSATVAIFFYMFLNFGSESVKIFLKEPNITNNDGVYAATLAVYASFIFMSSAFLSVPYIVKNIWVRIVCIISILIVAITSGRSAILISCFVGVLLAVIFSKFQINQSDNSSKRDGSRIIILISLFLAIFLFFLFIQGTSNIDFVYTIESVYLKIFDAGGEARRDQWLALLEGISGTSGLGIGHGVSAGIIRSEEFPWRYELFPIAMIYRVGIFGFSLLIIPYFIYIFKFVKAMLMHQTTQLDSFMFAGFLGISLGSFTNPYPESFIYQWMLLGPMVLFEEYHRNLKNVNQHTRNENI